MKTKKIACFAVAVACVSALAFAGCKENKENEFRPTPVNGISFVFDDGSEYYSVAPSVIVEGNTVYAYYTTNVTANKNDRAIAVRVGSVSGDGNYSFGARKIVLQPSEGGWDAGLVSDADVVKGSFAYEGTTYTYLMAYQGCADQSERNQQIGVALANDPAGPFVKVKDPVISYDPVSSGYGWGVGQPSLVSFDRAGKVRMYYTVGDSMYTYMMTAELDCSDCSKVTGANSAFMMPVEGLTDTVPSETVFNNAGFAVKGEELVVSRDRNPVASSAPTLASAVQVAKMPLLGVYTDDASWTVLKERINWADLQGDTEYDGWQRVYSSSIVKDFYGEMYGETATVFATVTSYDEETREYLYRQGIILYRV